ncbi:amidinotransferase [Jiangella rhizosphaerae]|uniref:Amidinotransferase n=2 Tax=Jiangella rhizosphaerae TaxID=2293569 RepID=A0A418KHN0_9ACTN|nr:amidinotransferase [Jiangella rhizosphaerae]
MWARNGTISITAGPRPYLSGVTVNDARELTRLPSRGHRVATTRDYVMCRPDHFAVHYSINVWMDPSRPVDRDRALAQWEHLRATYERLGHRVHLLDPRPGLPDMVFAANGAFVVGDRALGARFRELVRADEAPAHRAWLEGVGIGVTEPVAVNEGEGDFAWAGGRILAGAGFRSDPAAHAELAAVFGVPVVPLELVDPRFYHLDTALAVLDRHTIAYYPPAFSPASQDVLATLFPEAIVATEADALVLGLNAVSDGRHVVLAAQARELADAVARAGFEPVPVDVSELLKSGGGIKCATLELHHPSTAEEQS